MQKKLLCAIFALLIFAIPCWAKPVISIQPFIDKAGVGSQIASAITDMMTTELMNTGAFDIVERERLGEIGAEQKLGQSGLVDSSTAPKVGKLTGAEYMITGAITQFHYQTPGGAAILPGVGGGFVSNTGYVTLDVRIVSNTTGRVTFTSRQEGAATNSSGALISVFGGFGTIKHGGVMAAKGCFKSSRRHQGPYRRRRDVRRRKRVRAACAQRIRKFRYDRRRLVARRAPRPALRCLQRERSDKRTGRLSARNRKKL